MNVHHLELFYYVGRHGGIAAAVRNIPYGIQQPAVSAQIAQLEEFLGVTLFHRRPFALTKEGEKLYQFILPFFSNLDQIGAELQGGQVRHIRIGASTIVLRDHLPGLIRDMKQKFPGLRISLRDGYPGQLTELLLAEEVDLVATVIENKPPAGLRSEKLVELPLVLLVEKSSRVTAAQQLWQRDKIDEPLICLPPGETMCKLFQQKLAALGVDWFPSIEASAADMVETYVAGGLGIGLSVGVPGRQLADNVRVVPLPDFPGVVLGVMWRGKISPMANAFLEEFRVRAKRLTLLRDARGVSP
jgi:DNA-binding transcriptional LysR family regulator